MMTAGTFAISDRGRLAAGGRSRLRRRGRRDGAVPAARRRLRVHRLIRRRIGRKGLNRELGGDERLLIEAARDILALLGGVLVALLRGEREPLVGFGEVLVDADAARVKNAEIV